MTRFNEPRIFNYFQMCTFWFRLWAGGRHCLYQVFWKKSHTGTNSPGRTIHWHRCIHTLGFLIAEPVADGLAPVSTHSTANPHSLRFFPAVSLKKHFIYFYLLRVRVLPTCKSIHTCVMSPEARRGWRLLQNWRGMNYQVGAGNPAQLL